MDPDLLSKRSHKLCDRLGVHIYRNLYGLRHYAATSLVKAGVDIRTVAGRLGNDPAVTLRRYAHVVSDADLAAVTGWPSAWPTSWPTSSGPSTTASR
jgi:integrase